LALVCSVALLAVAFALPVSAQDSMPEAVRTTPQPLATLNTLYSFDGPDGAAPVAALLLGNDGNYYGTTAAGGTYGWGTVYKLTPSGTLTTLHSFAGYPSDGASPDAALVLGIDGNYYGTTRGGGPMGIGTVFKITPSGTLTTLYNFGGNRAGPYAALVRGADGDLWGTTMFGGST